MHYRGWRRELPKTKEPRRRPPKAKAKKKAAPSAIAREAWLEEAEQLKREGLERVERTEKRLAALNLPADLHDELAWVFSQARMAQHHIVTVNRYLNLLWSIKREWDHSHKSGPIMRLLRLVKKQGQKHDGPYLAALYLFLTSAPAPGEPAAVVSHDRRLYPTLFNRPLPAGAERLERPVSDVKAVQIIGKFTGQGTEQAGRYLREENTRGITAGFPSMKLPGPDRLGRTPKG